MSFIKLNKEKCSCGSKKEVVFLHEQKHKDKLGEWCRSCRIGNKINPIKLLDPR